MIGQRARDTGALFNDSVPYRSSASTQPPAAGEVMPPNRDEAVEALSTILRDFGHYSFDTETMDAARFNEVCDQWARHVLYGAASPRATDRRNQVTEASSADRDWLGLRHFLLEHRQGEYAYVMQSVGGMRAAIWSFVRELSRSVSADRQDDALLKSAMRRLEEASNQRSVEVMRHEIAATTTALTRMLAERRTREQEQVQNLNAHIKELGSQLEEVRHESEVDPLTRLHNRKALDVMLSRAVYMRTVFSKTACLLMVDVDHFKQVNDTYGHVVGDAVLKAIADCLTRSFPRKGDDIARYGGEEFTVVLPETSREEGREMAERLLRAARELRVEAAGEEMRFTLSVGVTEALPDDSVQSWVHRADSALYLAKENGRDRAESL